MQLLIHPYTLHLKHTFRIAHGSRDRHDTVLVELLQDGLSGWGEASCSAYFGVTQMDLLRELQQIKPRLEKYELNSLAHFNALLKQFLPESSFVRSALDSAAHDLLAKTKGVSTRHMLGLERSKTPRSCFTIGMDSKEEMAKRIMETPWPVYKLKMGGQDDLTTLEYLRKFTEAPFQLDANGAWPLPFAKKVCDQCEALNIILLEQPLSPDDWAGHQALRAYSPVPIIADEACMTLDDILPCSNSYDGINIKLPKCGGMYSALQMIEKAKSLNIEIMMGCMTESSVGISAIAQLAPLVDHIDLDGALLLSDDPAEGISLHYGRIDFPFRPGNGCRINKK